MLKFFKVVKNGETHFTGTFVQCKSLLDGYKINGMTGYKIVPCKVGYWAEL